MIKVTLPKNVKSVEMIQGKNFHVKKGLEFFVLARDGMWYLQKRPEYQTVFKHKFTVEMHFGDDGSPLGTEYTVAAVRTKERPESPMMILPKGKTKLYKVILG